MANRSHTALALIVLLVGWSGAAPAATALGGHTVLGYTASNGVTLDGTAVPNGTTLLSPSLLTTGATQGVVQLAGGQAVLLAQHSSALLEATADGVRLSMEGGTATLRDGRGEVVTLAQNGTMLLAAQEPGEGDPVEQEDDGEDEEEGDDGAGAAPAAGGGSGAGLSTAAWVGIGVAAVGAAVIIAEDDDDDDTSEASP